MIPRKADHGSEGFRRTGRPDVNVDYFKSDHVKVDVMARLQF